MNLYKIIDSLNRDYENKMQMSRFLMPKHLKRCT